MRTLSQLKVLASLPEVDSVTLLSVTESHVQASLCQALSDAVPKLRVLPPVHHPIHLFRSPLYVPRVVILRLLGIPYLAAKWDSPRLRRCLRDALRRFSVDLVYMDHLGMARYLSTIAAERPLAPVVLEQHNVESDIFKRFAESGNGAVAPFARVEWRAAERFERRVLQTVEAVVAMSNANADRFHQFAGVQAHVVPVVVEFQRKARPYPGRPHFCYVGSLRWRPNVAGLDWFCQHVWPRIRGRLPDATMEIAGVDLAPNRNGKVPVPSAWKVAGVQTIGFVEDPEPLYARSVAMLAPVIGASGVRIKILEGLRAGLPVVTTVDGALGLPLEDGKEALIASEPDAFADRVVRLAHDEHLRARLRGEGTPISKSTTRSQRRSGHCARRSQPDRRREARQVRLAIHDARMSTIRSAALPSPYGLWARAMTA